ncbi:MAG: hypothetical protein K2L27_01770 [Muribaculaceae bacterium]|nr:hypothetical protein [Muribaculaceae bacterium]
MNDTAQKLYSTIRPETCLSFDAEFARGMEMLELSAVSLDGRLVYSRRFKPRRYRTWDSDIHHITPAMVATAPSFSSCRRQIQAIVDRCSYIVGFAVRENDIAKMKRQHIHTLDSKHVLELRDWFWICHGRERGLDYVQGISLKLCCEQLGIATDDERAHTSAYDAAVTLKCFKILFERFVDSYGAQQGFATFADVVAHFKTVFARCKRAYDAERAAGFCTIMRAGDEYMVKATRERPELSEQTVECIAVGDRKKALKKLSEKFTGTQRSRSFFFRRLSDKQLAYFRGLSAPKKQAL